VNTAGQVVKLPVHQLAVHLLQKLPRLHGVAGHLALPRRAEGSLRNIMFTDIEA
jgi:hypothetical protein